MAIAESTTHSLLSLSSNALEIHLRELEEECDRLVRLIGALRSTEDTEKREMIEGDLYASLIHLKNHVQPAIKEWDRLVDEMPDDEEDDSTE
jgi:hypothetical protein